ncbi:FG-GAP repeat domain-containing protein [Alienimonas californiensis]|uniref:FG-GAP repeat protein n=1 Tax=Alienimonas californiensis TaxID=2527989 RepID=A0A517P6I7_9PLAN|nr:VCBS repeat-containing protein [Alienimonas californiensis]QDT14972.1 FG-GAP repeat protein [Alienimonas californiensis]
MSLLLLAALFAAPPADADAWPRHTIDASSRGADGVRLADVDGDGRLDVVTGWEEGGTVRVAFGPPLEQVRQPWPSVAVGRVGSPEDAVAVDLDGDGRLEVLSCSEGRTRRLSVHHAAGDPRDADSWTTTPLGDSDGRQQYMFALPWPEEQGGGVIVAGKGPGAAIEWWRPGADPADWAAWRATPLRPLGWAMSLRAEDMDGDGDPDLLLTDRRGNRRGAVWLEFDPASAGWEEHPIGAADLEPMFLTVADLDGDGDRDVAVAAKDAGLVLFGRLNATGDRWRSRTLALPDTAGGGKGVAAARTAGGLEVFVSCEHSGGKCSILRFHFDPGSDVWTAAPTVDCPAGVTGTKFDRLELLDLDADGDLDLLACEERENLGVIWYERPGPAAGDSH